MTGERETTVCFTGHRDLPGDIRGLKAAVDAEIESLYAEGMRIFCAGGAVGFDMLASEAVPEAGKRLGGIKLRLVLPCAGHFRHWDDRQRRRFLEICAGADRVDVLSPVFYPGCMHVRYKELADRASVCVAYLTKSEGGTASTVKYATKQGLKVINLAGAGPENGYTQISIEP